MLDLISPNIVNIAREYFKDILYIDDAIKKPTDLKDLIYSANQESAATIEAPNSADEQSRVRRPAIHLNLNSDKSKVADDEKNEDLEQKMLLNNSQLDDYFDAFEIIYNLNNDGCKVSPYFFEGVHQVGTIVSLIEKSHLTILDWELDLTGGETTLNILESVFETKGRLKLLVIYTKNPLQAARMIREKFNDNILDNDNKQIDGSTVEIFDLQDAFILICKKRELPGNKLLDTFIELLIKKFGFFQFVFFDSINKIVGETATILKQFSYPFENTLLLQLQSSGFNSTDYAKIVSRMVTNHITKVIDVETEILEEITEQWKRNIIALLQLQNEQFKDQINDKLLRLEQTQNDGTNGKKNKEYIEALRQISAEQWREIFTLLNSLDLNDASSLKPVIDLIFGELLTIKAKKKFEGNRQLVRLCGDNQELKNQCINLCRAIVKEDAKSWVKPILPSILISLIVDKDTSHLSNTIVELVNLMKVISYKETGLGTINSILNTNGIVNYFNSGDILIASNQYLLCISPSCDVFRPDKVNNKLKFVTGKKIDSDATFKNLSSYEHLTILPDHQDEEKLICIVWDFSDIQVLEIQNLSNFTRPYRLEPGYIQQIMNAYIAYQSRTGVDELFVKSSSSLRNLYVFN